MLRVKHRRFNHFRTPKAPTLSILGQTINHYRLVEKYYNQFNDLCGHFYTAIWHLMPLNEHLASSFERLLELPLHLFGIIRRQRFNNTLYRYAFFYLYFTCHTHAIKILWRELTVDRRPMVYDWFNTIFKTETVNVFCFGGGAGCEIVGFFQFLQVIRIKPQFRCIIVDPHEWALETMHLLRTINPKLGTPTFHQVEFSKIRPHFCVENRILNELRNADLITVGTYLSSMLEINAETIMHFKILLDQMKPLALLFFIDKVGNDYLESMRGIALSAGLTKVSEISDKDISVPDHEIEAMNENHFTTMPETSLRVCASLWQKL